MILMRPNDTPYDLHMVLFGTHVRIHPLFWLMGVILGWNLATGAGLGYLALWIFWVFISILLHEFGHVWMGQLFGRHGHIVLYGMGGLAIGIYLDRRWQRVLVFFAGPLAQLLLFGVVILAKEIIAPQLAPRLNRSTTEKMVVASLEFLWFINLYWPILNLMPIWPLDGGQIANEFCTWLSPRKGRRIALGISIALAGLIAVNALASEHRDQALIPYLPQGLYAALLFGLLALGSYQALQAEEEPPWKQWN